MSIDFQEKFFTDLEESGRGRNVREFYEEWCQTPREYINNKTPREYFEEIEDINTLIDMLKIYKKDLPPLLLERIKKFKSKSVKPLCDVVLNEDNLFNNSNQHITLNGIYILGKLGYAGSVPSLLKVIELVPEGSAPFNYALDAITETGDNAIKSVINRIKSTEDPVLCGHFAWILTRLGRDDAIFETLSGLCENSPLWQGYYGELLVEYGDSRAIEVIQKVALNKKYSYEEHDQFEKALVLLGGEWDWDYEFKKSCERKRQGIKENTEMVLIPSGEFIMGDNRGFDNEKPQHRVKLKAFLIDKYPVTVKDYKEFQKLTGYKSEPDDYRPDDSKNECPVTYVSFDDAKAYAEWLGKRLPTEAEWEKAARGTDGRLWPWGNEWDESKLASREGNYTEPVPVGIFPEGKSPYGVMDMAGNVWEWTSDSEQKYPYKKPFPGEKLKLFKGGSWSHDKIYARCSMRYLAGQDGWANDLGFRCAMSLEE